MCRHKEPREGEEYGSWQGAGHCERERERERERLGHRPRAATPWREGSLRQHQASRLRAAGKRRRGLTSREVCGLWQKGGRSSNIRAKRVSPATNAAGIETLSEQRRPGRKGPGVKTFERRAGLAERV
jgi:hypothetical protein